MATERYDGADPVNIGAGFEISIRELAALVAESCGFTGRIAWDTTKPNGQPRRSHYSTLAKQLFGFTASTPFEDGLARTVAWYRHSRDTTGNVA
jgi:GDP-L-fucose synthase